MGLLQDLRFAARLLVKDKWFTLVAVVALGLGIGVNNSVFTTVNAMVFKGLPFKDADRIMAISSYDPVRARELSASYLDFKDWRAATHAFGGIAAYNSATMNVSDEGRLPERFNGSFISANGFDLIGQQPILGRLFRADDDQPGATPVVILGYGVWKTRYGGEASALGRVIRVNEVPSTVIGVMSEDFKFPQNTELWQPLALIPDLEKQARTLRTFDVFGRLADRVTPGQARAELIAIGARLTADHPDTNKDIQPRVQTFNEKLLPAAGRMLVMAEMGAVAFVLLIACANVANLLLARSAHRAREVSVRVSLGATRWRIVRQLLIESVMLAVLGGGLGLLLSVVGIDMLETASQDLGKPYWMSFTMDGRVLAFLAAICLGTGLVFGIAPALHVSKSDVNEVLKEGGRSGSAGARARRWTGGLIMAELALTVVLLAGAGFMTRSFLGLYHLDLGIETSHLLTMRLALPDRKYPSLAQRTAFYERLEARLRANPRMQAVSIASNVPLQSGLLSRLAIEGRPLAAGERPPTVTTITIDPSYFETLGIKLVQGRVFNDSDGLAGHESVIVNQRFAQVHFRNDDPVGKRIQLTPDTGAAAAPAAPPVWASIIGVAPIVRQRNVAQPDPDPIAYIPLRSDPRAAMTLLARVQGDPAQMTSLVREEVRAIDPDLPVFGIQTMDQRLALQRLPFKVFGTMFAVFALIALLLSAIGLYAVTAYSVTQRTQEIGLRMALGARSTQVMWLFLRRAFFHLAVGMTIGIAGAVGMGKILEKTTLLVQTTGQDPVTLLSITALLALVAIVACLWPARRAAQLDPLVALRCE
jgi:putative ABC transport system permease protein